MLLWLCWERHFSNCWSLPRWSAVTKSSVRRVSKRGGGGILRILWWCAAAQGEGGGGGDWRSSVARGNSQKCRRWEIIVDKVAPCESIICGAQPYLQVFKVGSNFPHTVGGRLGLKCFGLYQFPVFKSSLYFLEFIQRVDRCNVMAPAFCSLKDNGYFYVAIIILGILGYYAGDDYIAATLSLNT